MVGGWKTTAAQNCCSSSSSRARATSWSSVATASILSRQTHCRQGRQGSVGLREPAHPGGRGDTHLHEL